MIVITGAMGFIGSCLVGRLNRLGYFDLLLVDDAGRKNKLPNLTGKQYAQHIGREELLDRFPEFAGNIRFVFHLGARTDTTLMDKAEFDRWNLHYSQQLWRLCSQYNIPLVYASSAATYGSGEHGFSDEHSLIPKLKPLNPYGESKQEFDLWALQQVQAPPFWAGLKFFNVYGPNEYHKGRMASVIYHAYRQIAETEQITLFKSHNPDFNDGGQMRDFIYVKDILETLIQLMYNKNIPSAIYNLGTGNARSFIDLANAVFQALNKEPKINFIDTPKDIREKYQYYTRADMQKLNSTGISIVFTSLKDGITDYVSYYLATEKYY